MLVVQSHVKYCTMRTLIAPSSEANILIQVHGEDLVQIMRVKRRDLKCSGQVSEHRQNRDSNINERGLARSGKCRRNN